MKQVNILAGGPPEFYPDQLFKLKGEWIGVDRGNLRLLGADITPQLAVGDFDSMTATELNQLKKKVSRVLQVNPIKDETDTELALKQANTLLHADKIDLYGMTGGRLDHFLSNLLMFLKPDFKEVAPKVRLIDRQNIILFLLPGVHHLVNIGDYKYLSFVSLGNVTELTLPDEKYRLHKQTDLYPTAYVSNEFLNSTATVSFVSGMVAVIYSRD
ncbi:thiamine diphosphokinase [Pediococcus siamensis]|uniref:thiamine diphosphokinase n=1 Tax=Pediococcus siamensis TaxID=381829 RepID=UPI0039A00E72